jgi:uncharacterized membrane protein YdjX (TVP38/TMEM64 family)
MKTLIHSQRRCPWSVRKALNSMGLTLIGLLIATAPAIAQDATANGGFSLQGLLGDALQWVQNLGPAGAIAFIGIYILATVAFLPGSILTLGGGALFGIVLGSVYVFVGATIGATAAFLIGRYVARDWVTKKIEGNASFKTIDGAVGREGLKIVTLLRLSPVFPFNLLNYALGVTGVSLRDYVIACLGMIPGTVAYVYLGSVVGNVAMVAAGEQLDSTENAIVTWVIRIIGLIATFAVAIYVAKVARKALSEQLPENSTASEHEGSLLKDSALPEHEVNDVQY